MLLEAQKRHYQIAYAEITDLYVQDGQAYAQTQSLIINDKLHDWYQLCTKTANALSHFDIILMRKDPPFNMNYIYCTYLSEQ